MRFVGCVELAMTHRDRSRCVSMTYRGSQRFVGCVELAMTHREEPECASWRSFPRPLSSLRLAQRRDGEVGREDQGCCASLGWANGPGEHPHGERIALAAVQDVDLAGRPVVVDDPDRDRVAQLPGDRPREGVIPDRPVGVANNRRGTMDHPGYLDHDAQVGPSSGEVLANRRLDLAAAECDPILAWNGNLVPPLEVIPGVGDEVPVGMVPKVVAEPACDLGHVVGVSETVIVSLTIRVAVPVTEDPVPGFDGLTDELPSCLVALQVVLEPLDPGCETGGIAPGVISGPLDIAVVDLVDIIVQMRLDLGPMWAVGMLRKELAGLVDQFGKRRVRQRFAANQIVNELSLDGGPARR